jgi:hypothetical protein
VSARDLGLVWGAAVDCDEGVTRIVLHTDDESYVFRPSDVEAARQIVAAVDDLREYVAEHDRERAAYDRATPEERMLVAGLDAVHGALGREGR